jgi:predicted RNase H-like HicB family nuclease
MESLAKIRVGLEEGADGWVMAHALNLPGCAAAGSSSEAAVGAFERVLMEWLRFLAAAREPVPPPDAELEIAVDEWVATDARVRRGETEALFADDLRALEQDEAERGVQRLGELRSRVLARVRRRPDALLDAETPGGMTARQVLEELARAQWWTLSRLGATPMAEVPEKTLARLDTAMALVVDRLTTLPDDARGRRLELDGEEWTPRKVLRRLLWLEWTLGAAAIAALAPVVPEPTAAPVVRVAE